MPTDPAKPLGEEELLEKLREQFMAAFGTRDGARALLAAYTAKVREEMANLCQEIAHKHEGEIAKMRSASDDDDYCEDMDAAWNRSRGARECEAAIRARGGEGAK